MNGKKGRQREECLGLPIYSSFKSAGLRYCVLACEVTCICNAQCLWHYRILLSCFVIIEAIHKDHLKQRCLESTNLQRVKIINAQIILSLINLCNYNKGIF
jgi:hypothetical protein